MPGKPLNRHRLRIVHADQGGGPRAPPHRGPGPWRGLAATGYGALNSNLAVTTEGTPGRLISVVMLYELPLVNLKKLP